MLELSKTQRKVARELIDVGLEKELENGINIVSQIIQKWKDRKAETKETYYQIFVDLKKFDKHIAQRYDNMKGSTYLLIIAGQLIDGVISVEDLNGFDQEVKNKIISLSKFYE